MASQVEICNAALYKVGAARITSLADGTKYANILSSIWELKRDSELQANWWTFAIARHEAAALDDAPVGDWSYQYLVPSGFLAMVQLGEDLSLYEDDTGPQFEIEGGRILTDQAAPLFMRYVKRVTNTGEFSPLFAEALACRLAVELCEAATQSLPKKELLIQQYKAAIREARRANAIELPPRRHPTTSWERALMFDSA